MAEHHSVGTPSAERLAAQMAFLTELAGVIARNTELQPILDWMVQKTTAMMGADEGSIRLVGEDPSDGLRTVVRKTRDHVAGSWPKMVSASVMGFLVARNEPLTSPDVTSDPRFGGLAGTDTHVHAVLAVPLKIDNRFTGMLAVTERAPGRQWTPDEVQLLSIVAQSSAGAIEQARLRIEALEKQKVEEELRREQRDLERARDIQARLLPGAPLVFGPWQACGKLVSARQVGGDAFDYFALDEARFCAAIADVSGKGAPAALLMSNVQALLRAYCSGRQPLATAVGLVNEGIARSIANGQFITAFVAEIDTARGVLRYANAGHNPPLVRRASGAIEELGHGELPLGILADAGYEEHEVPFAPGDTLVLYSDGVTEAINLRREMYGEERLNAVWSRVGSGPPAAAVDAIYAEVEAFRGMAEQSDDITIVVVGPAG